MTIWPTPTTVPRYDYYNKKLIITNFGLLKEYKRSKVKFFVGGHQ